MYFPLVTAFFSLKIMILYFLKAPVARIDNVALAWSKSVLNFLKITVKVNGLENIPKDKRGFVLLFNHSSFFDIFVILNIFSDLRFGAKEELFKIPLFAGAMRASGTVPIARQSRHRSIKALGGAVDRLKAGAKLALAPEGTRSLNDINLNSFKSGPFYLINQAQCLAFPCVIKGASVLWPKGYFWPLVTGPSTIEVWLLNPIAPARDQDKKAVHDIKDQVYHVMKNYF